MEHLVRRLIREDEARVVAAARCVFLFIIVVVKNCWIS